MKFSSFYELYILPLYCEFFEEWEYDDLEHRVSGRNFEIETDSLYGLLRVIKFFEKNQFQISPVKNWPKSLHFGVTVENLVIDGLEEIRIITRIENVKIAGHTDDIRKELVNEMNELVREGSSFTLAYKQFCDRRHDVIQTRRKHDV